MSERALLMIPGPFQVDPEVLRVLARPQLGHMDPEFARALGRMRDAFDAPGGQPLVVAGSGSLAMEIAVANVVDPEDRAVVINTGVFADRMRSILEHLSVRVDDVRAPIGDIPDLAAIEKTIAAAPTKIVCITHVDTS